MGRDYISNVSHFVVRVKYFLNISKIFLFTARGRYFFLHQKRTAKSMTILHQQALIQFQFLLLSLPVAYLSQQDTIAHVYPSQS